MRAHEGKPSLAQIDAWREQYARALHGYEAALYNGGNMTRSFAELRREFFEWFNELASFAMALEHPLAPGAADTLADYPFHQQRHEAIGDVLLDLHDAGCALEVRGDRQKLAAIDNERRQDEAEAEQKRRSARAAVASAQHTLEPELGARRARAAKRVRRAKRRTVRR